MLSVGIDIKPVELKVCEKWTWIVAALMAVWKQLFWSIIELPQMALFVVQCARYLWVQVNINKAMIQLFVSIFAKRKTILPA